MSQNKPSIYTYENYLRNRAGLLRYTQKPPVHIHPDIIAELNRGTQTISHSTRGKLFFPTLGIVFFGYMGLGLFTFFNSALCPPYSRCR